MNKLNVDANDKVINAIKLDERVIWSQSNLTFIHYVMIVKYFNENTSKIHFFPSKYTHIIPS